MQPEESQIRKMTRLAMQHGAVNLAQGFPNEGPEFEAKFGVIEAILSGSSAGSLSTSTVSSFLYESQSFGDMTLFDFLKQVEHISGGANLDTLNQYSVPFGLSELRSQLATYYQRFYDYNVNPDTEITVTLGATEAMAAAFRTVAKPGDGVLIFEPFHELYPNQAHVFYLIPLYCSLRPNYITDEWEVNWETFDSAMDSGHVKVIVLNTPHNPTGKVFTLLELRRICDTAIKYDVWVITDEIYEHMLLSKDKTESHHLMPKVFPEMTERTIVISAISKTGSATGWRIGWALHPSAITTTYRAIHDQTVLQAPTPIQWGVKTYLNLSDEYFKYKLPQKYQQRRDMLISALRELGFRCVTPHACYYAFCDYRHVPVLSNMSSWDACMYLVSVVKVGTVAGENFCEKSSGRGGDFIRFCFCRKEDTLQLAIDRMRDVLLVNNVGPKTLLT